METHEVVAAPPPAGGKHTLFAPPFPFHMMTFFLRTILIYADKHGRREVYQNDRKQQISFFYFQIYILKKKKTVRTGPSLINPLKLPGSE